MSGTKPGSLFPVQDYHEIKEQLITLPDRLQSDYDSGMFKTFIALGTMNFEGVFKFLADHEARHLSIIHLMLTLISSK